MDSRPSTEQQKLDLMVRGKQDLKIQGPRLNQTKEDKMVVKHGPDRRLDPIITPPCTLMEVALTHSLLVEILILSSNTNGGRSHHSTLFQSFNAAGWLIS